MIRRSQAQFLRARFWKSPGNGSADPDVAHLLPSQGAAARLSRTAGRRQQLPRPGRSTLAQCRLTCARSGAYTSPHIPDGGKERRMALEIKLLSLIDIDIESSFLVLGRDMGVRTRIPTFGFLILGGKEPVLVDTGAINAEIMQRLGMTGYIEDGMTMEAQLAKYDLMIDDVRWVLHTHLHIDHCGQDHLFPSTTTVAINRRELEYSVSGLMGEQYPAEYIKHLIDRLHTPGALRLLDLELSGPEEI